MAGDQHSQMKDECIYPSTGHNSNSDLLEKLGLLEERTKKIKI